MKKYIMLLMLSLMSCSEMGTNNLIVDGREVPLSSTTGIAENEAFALASNVNGEYMASTKIQVLRSEDSEEYPIFAHDVEFSYYSDGLVKQVHYVDDNAGLYFTYSENNGKISSVVYKYYEGEEESTEKMVIDDISPTERSSILSDERDTIPYTNSGYKDTTLYIDIEGDTYKYVINSFGQVDSIYEYTFSENPSAISWFKYDEHNRLSEKWNEWNLVFASSTSDIMGGYSTYEYSSENILKKQVKFAYTRSPMHLSPSLDLDPYRMIEFNDDGFILSEKAIVDADTVLAEKYLYNENNCLLEYDGGDFKNIYKYDDENNLIYEKSCIKKDGSYDTEVTYEYEKVMIQTKDKEMFDKIKEINKMIYETHYGAMVSYFYNK